METRGDRRLRGSSYEETGTGRLRRGDRTQGREEVRHVLIVTPWSELIHIAMLANKRST